MSVYPPLQEVKDVALKGEYNLIPVCKEIFGDFDTPTALFARLQHCAHVFLLESITGGENLARNSFIGYNPARVLRIKGNRVTIDENGEITEFETETPLDYFQQHLASYRGYRPQGFPPFTGGAVGFFAYDAIRYVEDIPCSNNADFYCDDAYYVFTDKIIIFDNVDHKIQVVFNIRVDEKRAIETQYKEAIAEIDKMIEEMRAPLPPMGKEIFYAENEDLPATSNYTKEAFCEMVEKAKEHIKRGDIFQVVPSQRFSLPLDTISPLNIYRALRVINPSPYMFFLKFKGLTLIGSSPEILVKQEGGTVTVRPIAGTRWRGKTEEEDKALAEDLLADEKEMAEHLMLVDLGRNDVGRVSEFGTVSVDEYAVIERYAHVMHIVSNVIGTLAKGKTNIDVVKSAFPAGTVSGAPKVRAMEIIDELENVQRGPYAGCVGYFSFSGDMDTAIMLRTMFITDETIYVQAGAGIVYDSVPEREYEETLNKAKSLMKAISMAKQLQ